MYCTAIEERADCDFAYVHCATVSVLVKFLDASVPWVWILSHRPNRSVHWWETTVPLNKSGQMLTGSVRNICLDLQMATSDFVSRSTDFDDHGLLLIQSRKEMPDTLCLERLPDQQQNSVLLQNGATMRIYLPHAFETASVESFKKGYLSTIIGK